MKLLIVSPGKNHDYNVVDAIEEYEKRLSPYFSSIDWEFPTVSTKEEEGSAILKKIRDDDTVVLLDEKGKIYSSIDFAKYVDIQFQDGKKRLVFIIGGAFGVSENVKQRADIVVSLSKMVFPHMLVRLILIEQIYRALMIIKGSKYHHE